MSILIDKIHEDARAKANSTMEEGGKKAAEVIKQAQNDVTIFKTKCLEESAALRDEILRRRLSVANLEVKKLMLAAKKEKLNEVYQKARQTLQTLPKEKYLDLISKMLTLASDGDTVKIAAKDKDVITAEFIASYGKSHGISLSLAKDFANISGGVILCGNGYDKNISLDTELATLREETESDIAKQLFGEF